MSNSIIDSIQHPEFTAALPCPFCGGVAHYIHSTEEGVSDGWMIDCGNDQCEVYCVCGPFHTLEAAKAAWNKRGTP